MITRRVEKIAAETFVRRDLHIERAVVADLKDKLDRYAGENASTILEFLPAERIEFYDCLTPIADRYRSQLPEDEDPRDWFVMRMEAKTVATQAGETQ